jgi:antitoxin MazE
MVKKLTKTGNSLALVLDKPLLEQLGIDADTPLEIASDGEVLVISPVREKKRTERLRGLVERMDAAFAGAFHRLAK